MTAAVAELVDEVEALAPGDAREAASQARMLFELRRLTHPLSEDAQPTHVTASALVVGPRGVLLHRHKRLGIWMQPGGHVEPGETPRQAVVREVREETGLRVAPVAPPRLVHVDVHPAPKGHVHLDVRYLLDGPSADPSPAVGESQEVGWFAWADALAVADAALVGALRRLGPGA